MNVTQNLIRTVDATPPTASNPANITLSGCNGTFPAPDITVVADEADNCSGTITVAHVSDGTPSLVGCTETTVRTYSVTDACGNSINVTQNLIRTVDTTPPTASNPANITLSGCNGTFPAPNITVVADEADNCSGTITVAHVNDGTPTLVGCTETTVRTYSVTDACGNSINVTQNLIRTVDITPPTASNPANITLSGCNGTFPAPDITVVADEADNCSGTITVAYISDGTPSLVVCTETTVRTYSVTDACGNSINVTQNLIRTIDTTPPTASNPANITLSGCNGTFPAPDITVVADEADNCSGTITVAHVSDGTPSLVGCTETTVRTYSVTDACGNSINVTQNLIRTIDTTPPTASNPANITLSGCNGTFPTPDITVVADEADNCSGTIAVAHVNDGTPSLVGCTETTVRTYSVTDACGNSINVTQNLIRTVDTTPPTASNPANITLSGCNGTFPTPDITVVADEADNCSGTIAVAHVNDGTPSLVGCTETTVRTYSVTDACGNSINVTQNLIRTVDTTPPTASNPANITLSGCNGTFPSPDITVVADEADNCSGTITVAHVSDGTPSLVGCTETTVRTYSVTDACGNSINVTQNLIRTVDATPPTASNPANITLSGCNGTFPTPEITVVADEADNCSGTITVAYISDGTPSLVGCTETTVRTYSVTDACGNSMNVTQNLIRTVDTTPPSFTCPSTITQSSDSGICGAAINITNPTPTDNCGTPNIIGIRNDAIALNAVYPVGTTVITWTATDACGLTSSCTQSVIVSDNELPELMNCPSNIVVCQTNAEVTFTNPTATDNCAGVVVNQSTGLPSGATYPVGVTTNTFIAQDLANNNSAPCIFTVTVVANPTGGSITATEFCSGASVVSTVAGVSNATQYFWNLPAQLSGSSTTNSITLSGTQAGTYTITVTPQNVAGTTCNGSPVTGTVTVHPIPSVSVTNNDPAICNGGSTNIVLSSSPANVPGTDFNWTRDNTALVSGTNSANAVSGPISVALTHAQTTAQDVNFTITPVANGCTGDAVNTLVTVHPDLWVVTQPNNVSVCAGNGAVFNVAVNGGAGNISYQWQYFNGVSWVDVSDGTPAGSVYTNANSAMLSITNITASGVHQYHCVISASGMGCDDVTSNTATVTVSANATPAFLSPALSVCTNSQTVYTLNSTFNSYVWNITGGTILSGGGNNDHQVTVQWGGAGSGSVSVAVSDGNDCTGTVSENITINSRPTVTYCQDPDYCQINAGSILLNIQGGAAPYILSWTPNHGMPSSPVVINSAGNFTISGLHGNTDYLFILTDNNGCSP
jgi:hypothetical protein